MIKISHIVLKAYLMIPTEYMNTSTYIMHMCACTAHDVCKQPGQLF